MTTSILQVAAKSQQIIQEVERAIVGKQAVLEKLMAAALVSGGHVLLEDYPGLAKTMIAKSFAVALGLEFKRIQFTPDLLPGDITGGYVYDRDQNRFVLRKGPIFANIILADEINRASPKTQSALLEAMQEYQVTLEGETMRLPEPFIVLATQNPIEYEGTFPLPEAQLDRFIMKLSVGYPSPDEEQEILRRRRTRRTDEFDLQADHQRRRIAGAAGRHRACPRRSRHRTLHGRAGRCDTQAPAGGRGRQSTRLAGAAQARARLGGDAGPRLRAAR